MSDAGPDRLEILWLVMGILGSFLVAFELFALVVTLVGGTFNWAIPFGLALLTVATVYMWVRWRRARARR